MPIIVVMVGKFVCTFFLWEGQGHFFGISIKFCLRRAKGRGKRGMGEKPKMRVIFAQFPLFSKIQTLSHKLLVTQTSNHHHCNQHAQKPECRDFQVILSPAQKQSVNIYPQQSRQLQQGDWYSTAEEFQLC